MLKKLVFVVVILVFIGPTYDFAKNVLDKASAWIEDGQLQNQLQVTSESIQIEQAPDTTQEITESPVNEDISQKQQLKSTATNESELADAFYNSFKNWQTTFIITYKGDTKNIEQIIETAVANAFARDEYIFGHTGKRSITYEYSKTSATIQVEQSYLTNAQQESVVDQQVKEIVNKWMGLSDVEKVRAVNDYIVRNTVYTTQSSTSPHSAYAVLAEGKGVCQGYALLSLKMLQALGVEAKYVVGYVGEVGHAWNLVSLDGKWYHFDPTWNDPVPDRTNVVRYQYFLVDDATLAQDHSWIKSDYPAATSKRFAAIHNADYAVEHNGMLYYSNMQDNNVLYQMDLSTLQTSQLTNSRALYLVGYGDWIYFSNYSKGAYIAKIRTNGHDEEIVYDAESKDLFIEGSYLYFTSNGQQRIQLQ